MNLEKKIFESREFAFAMPGLVFLRERGDKLLLRRGINGGQTHFVDIVMPWGSEFLLDTYGCPETANNRFKHYNKVLSRGQEAYVITLNCNEGTAELAEKPPQKH